MDTLYILYLKNRKENLIPQQSPTPLGVCTGGNYWTCFEGLYLESSFLKVSPKHKLRRMTEVCLQPLGNTDVQQPSPFWHSCSQVLPEIKIWKPSEGIEIVNVMAKPSQIGCSIQSRVQAGWWQRWPHGPFKLHGTLSRAFWPIVGQVWRQREWEGRARKMGYPWPWSDSIFDSESLLQTTQGLQDPPVFDELYTTTFPPSLEGLVWEV